MSSKSAGEVVDTVCAIFNVLKGAGYTVVRGGGGLSDGAMCYVLSEAFRRVKGAEEFDVDDAVDTLKGMGFHLRDF